MSNRPALFLYLRLRHRKEKTHGIRVVLPLFVAFALVDMLEDWADLAALFRPRSDAGFLRTVRAASQVFWELAFRTGPLDLVDIDIQRGEKETLLLKLCTR